MVIATDTQNFIQLFRAVHLLGFGNVVLRDDEVGGSYSVSQDRNGPVKLVEAYVDNPKKLHVMYGEGQKLIISNVDGNECHKTLPISEIGFDHLSVLAKRV